MESAANFFSCRKIVWLLAFIVSSFYFLFLASSEAMAQHTPPCSLSLGINSGGWNPYGFGVTTGEPTTFTVSNRAAGVIYKWNFGGGSWLSGSNNSMITYTFAQPGEYGVSVQYTDYNGVTQNCPSIRKAHVYNSCPSANATITSVYGTNNLATICFTPGGYVGGARIPYQFDWNNLNPAAPASVSTTAKWSYNGYPGGSESSRTDGSEFAATGSKAGWANPNFAEYPAPFGSLSFTRACFNVYATQTIGSIATLNLASGMVACRPGNDSYTCPISLCPTPITCSASFNPTSGEVEIGKNFDAFGRVDSISGGNGTGYDYLWILKYSAGNFIFPPTVNPTQTGVWYPVRWNTAGVSLGEHYLAIQAKNKDKSWNDSVTCTNKITVAVTQPPAKPWFQTKGGDVYAETSIVSAIPSTAANTNFSINSDGFPGIISYGTGTSSLLPGGTVSSTDWLVNDINKTPTTYESIYQRLGLPTEVNYPCKVGSSPCPDPPSPVSGQTTVFYTDQKVVINSDWNIPLGAKVIVLINNDLEINKEIHVPQGSFLMFYVKGTVGGGITIKGSIGDKLAVSSPHLEGVYLTDGIINTNYDGDSSGKRLVLAGMFFTKNGFLLGRDLKNGVVPPATINNDLYPAELFILRPDLMVNSPNNIFNSSIVWKEVMP